MTLQLHESPVPYKEFFGRYHEQMPRLLAELRTPMTVAEIMRRRVDVAEGNAGVRDAWLDTYFDTSDAVLYHPSGKIKIVRRAPPLLTITTESNIRAGALVVDHETYHSIPGPEFARRELITGTPLTQTQACAHPVWQTLAGDDQSLLNTYTDFVFRDSKRRCGHMENMGVYLGPPQDSPVLRAWTVGMVDYQSDVFGDSSLSDHICRLVGVTPGDAPDTVQMLPAAPR